MIFPNEEATPNEGGTPDGTETSSGQQQDFFDAFMAGEPAPGESTAPTEDSTEGETPQADDVPPGEESEGVDEATALRQEISRLASVMASHGISLADIETTPAETTETTEPTPTQAPTMQTTPPNIWGPVVEVSEDDFQSSLENKQVFEKILTQVRDQAVERTVQSVPQLVQTMIKQQLYLNELSREFYRANEDLAGIRPFVGVVANEIASKNPGLKPEEVLEKTAIEVRTRLAMKARATQQSPSGPGPGLPNPGNRSKPTKPTLTGLEKELADLMEVR
jgi:hypothetical protein